MCQSVPHKEFCLLVFNPKCTFFLGKITHSAIVSPYPDFVAMFGSSRPTIHHMTNLFSPTKFPVYCVAMIQKVTYA
jgi:hypothetical protein